MKNKSNYIIKYILLIIPFILGIAGFCFVDGRPLLQSMYITCKLYILGGDEIVPNLLVEISRWLAPVATASGIIFAINYIRRTFFNSVAQIKGDSTAVYGPADEKELILKQLGRNGIDCDEKFVQAERYILLGSEEENLAFFNKHRAEISDKDVYAKCDVLSANVVAYHNLHLFCAEELAAAAFWKKHCIYKLSKEHGHKLKIAFIGFNKLGREVLLSAVQNNIFDPNQQIDYHIFGNAQGFCNIYHELKSQISDNIIFQYKQWHEQIDFLNTFDMVVVLQQPKQAQLLRDILLATKCKNIYVFDAADYGTDILENDNRLISFKWKNFVYDIDRIFDKNLFEKAKMLNLKYANLYSGVAINNENRESEWKKLSTFLRYSNISAADHNDIQRIILTEENQGLTPDTMSADWFERLSELEHIRWCRYHWINNWVYGETADGKKDSKNHIHPDLIPYDQLIDSEKQKDRDNITYLFS